MTKRSGAFNPTVVRIERPSHHYTYLQPPNGDWLATSDGETLHVQGHVDDAAIWDRAAGGFVHVATGVALDAFTVADDRAILKFAGEHVGADGKPGGGLSELVSGAVEFTVAHGPAELPSASLRTMREQGWVSLACVLSPTVVDGLQEVGCVDGYETRTPVKAAPLAQHPAVAQAIVEPVSLWLSRQYMGTDDIRLGHPPGISGLTQDDGQREVQGWHNDFPYLWGTGDRVPAPSGDLVLGVQRNTCVSDFTKDNGATVFKLGSHSSNVPPPEDWGRSTQTYRKGSRERFGLPYGGPEADVIEAPAGTIVLYDARTWHRAGMNLTTRKRGAMIQAIVPGYVMPFMDTSATFKAFLASEAANGASERERKEVEKLMVHKIRGPAGVFAIGVDEDLTARVRAQAQRGAAVAY